jgi:hypothetical protein
MIFSISFAQADDYQSRMHCQIASAYSTDVIQVQYFISQMKQELLPAKDAERPK